MTLTLDRDLGPQTERQNSANGAPSNKGAPNPRQGSTTMRSARQWSAQIALVLTFYGVYTVVRGQFGSASTSPELAAANARTVIGVEQWLGIYNEMQLQRWVMSIPGAIRSANIFYGTLHFAAPVAVLAFLYRTAPDRYRRWRNTLAATTALALIGFSLFPLMPPRLLCDCPLGSGTDSGFVDTLARFGGLWSFGSHGVGAVSNQYAAMPSLHFAWAVWCAAAAVPVLRRHWAKALVIAYPTVTLFVIVATANHFWLDAFGGALVVALGSGLGRLLEPVGGHLLGWLRSALANRRSVTKIRCSDRPESPSAGTVSTS